jgi:hypothetical protein
MCTSAENVDAPITFIKLGTSPSHFCIIKVTEIVSVVSRFQNGAMKSEITLRNNGTMLVNESVEDIWEKLVAMKGL